MQASKQAPLLSSSWDWNHSPHSPHSPSLVEHHILPKPKRRAEGLRAGIQLPGLVVPVAHAHAAGGEAAGGQLGGRDLLCLAAVADDAFDGYAGGGAAAAEVGGDLLAHGWRVGGTGG
ncbi:hypothetical protein MBM_08649 [Drepanopeziza brunnea f. sp. 'multigermtubi' MB_m1]|uniref:Uncharacterized protein n=1 Tax=Marssonina brunnea f. sp. multigermtubi (strain MB_m1) TaxID=1072389 RepID=K1WK33_MARBU|nr:uncharacterized protein MBM_08649 [Drepanopeziza brunnea f. sp. 'multigermtubi' MB_m1]EKD13206.1 hypothetical protein MBM_08649 [Drepanopeziza brunnea f. sp. 'multigermtubi' MB_m1]